MQMLEFEKFAASLYCSTSVEIKMFRTSLSVKSSTRLVDGSDSVPLPLAFVIWVADELKARRYLGKDMVTPVVLTFFEQLLDIGLELQDLKEESDKDPESPKTFIPKYLVVRDGRFVGIDPDDAEIGEYNTATGDFSKTTRTNHWETWANSLNLTRLFMYRLGLVDAHEVISAARDSEKNSEDTPE